MACASTEASWNFKEAALAAKSQGKPFESKRTRATLPTSSNSVLSAASNRCVDRPQSQSWQTHHAGVVLHSRQNQSSWSWFGATSLVQNFLSRLGVVTALDFAGCFDSVKNVRRCVPSNWLLVGPQWRPGDMPSAVPAQKLRNARSSSIHVSHSHQKLVLKWFLCTRQRWTIRFCNRLLDMRAPRCFQLRWK